MRDSSGISGYDPPLRGVRVIDLVSGPMRVVARHFIDFGADVTRVRCPRLFGEDGGFGPVVEGVAVGGAIAGRGAREVTVDPGTEDGRRAWEELLAAADILLENTEPGSAAEAALDVAAIRAAHPALVVLSISDFGRDTDLRTWRGSTPVYHALAGELSRSGLPGRDPLIPPGDLPYDVAAAQAVFLTLSVYLDRLRTGLGERVDFSVMDGAVQVLDPAFGMVGTASSGVPLSELPRGRTDERFRYPIVACADGYVRFCVLSKRQWHGMFEWMGRPEEFADPSYDDLRVRFASAALVPAIERHFAGFTRAELEEQGQKHGVPTAPVLTLTEALETDQIQARGFLHEVELAPGLTAPVTAGVMEIDGERAWVDAPPETELPGAAGPLPGPAAASSRGSVAGPPAAEPDGSPECPSAAPPDGQGSGPAALRSALPVRPGGADGLPLAGLRVLDLGVIVVGGDTGRLFGDLGADVVKIENSAFPDGSRASMGVTGMRAGFAAGHRNKRAIGVDLRDPEGRRLAQELVRTADVVLSNFKPGVLGSLGLDHAALKEINPGIVVVDSSAFGPTGPWAERLGYGPLVRAAAGCTDLWVYPGEPGSFSDAITVYPDHVCARLGALGALALLIRRERTARGGSVSVAQSEVMLSHFRTKIAAERLAARGHAAAGPEHDAPWGLFPCAGDDEWVAVTVRGDADWAALCGVLGRDDLRGDAALAGAAGRDRDRARIDAAVREWTSRRPPAEAMDLLQAAGVPAGRMHRAADLTAWPYARQRRLFREQHHPYGEEPYIQDDVQLHAERATAPPAVPAPLLGEQTYEIAADLLGLSREEVDDLVRRGILEAAPI